MGKKGTPWTQAQREAKSKAMLAYHARRRAESAEPNYLAGAREPKAPVESPPSLLKRLLAMVFGKATRG
tara:strand:+ start:509 stop:715 length:207 start_codon:yes stop_codon:yes gene_type:complete